MTPRMGVAIVAFNSADIIAECLESLFASNGVELRVVVVDNDSTDDTCQVIRAWASGAAPFRVPTDSPLGAPPVVAKPVALVETTTGGEAAPTAALTLVRSPVNGGYAYGCNRAIELLARDPAIDLFWVLNPDAVAPPATARALAEAGRDGAFSMMGGRTLYYERPDLIQTDGGVVSRRTGRCKSVHAGARPDRTPLPDPAGLDFISGAHLVASRRFVETVGPMFEDYFLYYEEVDWAFRRGALPLRIAADAVVYHRGGTSIGSGTVGRRASGFANYFNFRNRAWFVDRHLPGSRRGALAWALAKACQLAVRGAPDEARGIVAGALGLRPPREVASRVRDPSARARAFPADRPPGRTGRR